MRHGSQEGRLPNPYFDPAWYVAGNPDVVEAGISPLLHFVRHGDLEGRRPIACFDPHWYRAAHDLAPDRPALRHFLPRRTTGRFVPCAALYAVPHLARWRDCPARNEDPFRAFVDHMAGGGQDPLKDAAADVALLADSGLVDAGASPVRGRNAEGAALDPVQRFCRFGWQAMRKPNLYFDTAWYLATNPGVVRLGLNPLVHYVCEGEAANRRPAPYFDPAWYRATYGIPPEQNALAHYLAHRHSRTFSPTPLFDVAWYVGQRETALDPQEDPFTHFLRVGAREDVDPSPGFDAAAYRQRHMRPTRRTSPKRRYSENDNPLIHHLRAEYH